MLLFAMVMVCLAAATATELRENQKLARNAQDAVRNALCVAFPAMLLGGAVARQGYVRTMCISGLVPALVPLVTAFADLWVAIAHQLFHSVSGRLHAVSEALWLVRRVFVVMWAFIPCVSFVCLFVRWLWIRGEQGRRKQFAIQTAVFAMVITLAATAAVCKLPNKARPPDAQILLMVALTVVFPALLAVGAVQGRGYLRSFCIGGAVPTTFPLLLICASVGRNVAGFESPTDWSIVLLCLAQQRPSTAGLWACAPLFGLACVCFHWLFNRSEAKEPSVSRL